MADQDFKLSNVQGDIIVGLSKNTEIFFFFEITNAAAFQTQLQKLVPLITTADKAKGDREALRRSKARPQPKLNGVNGVNGANGVNGVNGVNGHATPPTNELGEIIADPPLENIVGVNIAFSQKGLVALKVADADKNVLGDDLFFAGQKDDAFALNDKGVGDSKETFVPDWEPAFLQETHEIHGVLLVTGDCYDSVNSKLDEVKAIFTVEGTSAIAEVLTLAGDVRPGKERGHEHFGYKDGISQPALQGVDDVNGKTPKPGQTLVDLGVVLTGRGQDTTINRAPWATDGSFLAFRKLPQFVPEFDRFLDENSKPIEDDFPDAPNPADILGARMVGRWKSGAPLRITPLVDDKELADDDQQNNKFKFNPNSQEICPYAAHIRKMNPRKDIPKDRLDPHLILRRGIPFGPEVTTEERLTKSTKHDRGLYFVSYQSQLSNGFSFLQKQWANNVDFPFPINLDVDGFKPGFDPIIGQAPGHTPTHDVVRGMTGYDDDATNKQLSLDRQWVESRGGEYFFSPSIHALSTVLAGQPEATPTQ